MTPKKRTWRDAFLLVLKGMAMGTANKIPGVSGGHQSYTTLVFQGLLSLLPTHQRNFSMPTVWWSYAQFFQCFSRP